MNNTNTDHFFFNPHTTTRHTSLVKVFAAFLKTSGAIFGTRSAYSPTSHKMLALAIGT